MCLRILAVVAVVLVSGEGFARDGEPRCGEIKGVLRQVTLRTFPRVLPADNLQLQADIAAQIIVHWVHAEVLPRKPNFTAVVGFSYAKVVGTGLYRPNGIFHHQRIFDSPQQLWSAVAQVISTRITELEEHVRESGTTPTIAHELQRLRAFSIFDIRFKFGSKGLSSDVLALFDQHRPREQAKIVEAIIQHLSRGGHLPTSTTLTKIGGVTISKAIGSGNYRSGKLHDHQRIFDNVQALWVAVAQEIQARILDLETQQQVRTLNPEEALVLQHLRTFSVFDILLNPGIGNLSPAMQNLYEYYRPQARIKLVGQIVNHWIKKGTLPNSFTFHELGEAYYAKATGGSEYRAGKPYHVQRIFDRASYMWIAVAQEIQARIAIVEAQEQARPLEPKEAQTLARLRAFSIFDVRFRPEEGELPSDILALYDHYRPQKQAQVVDTIIEHMRQGGTVPSWASFKRIVGENYAKATGGSGYRTGMTTHHQRIFDSTQALWQAVYEAARDRGLAPSDLDAICAKF